MKISENIYFSLIQALSTMFLKYITFSFIYRCEDIQEEVLAMATLVMMLAALTLLNVQGSLAAFDRHLRYVQVLYRCAANSIILDGPFDLCT